MASWKDFAQQAPELAALNVALQEMVTASNHGFGMYPGILHGAYEVIKAHAVPALRERIAAELSDEVTVIIE